MGTPPGSRVIWRHSRNARTLSAPTSGAPSSKNISAKKTGPVIKARRITQAGSRDEHGGALQGAAPQIGESLICTVDRVSHCPGPDTRLGRQREKFFGIAAGQVGDRAQPALLPKDPVRKARDVAHVNPTRDNRAPFLCRGERRRYKCSDRSEN